MAEFQMCWRTGFLTQACWLELLDSWGNHGEMQVSACGWRGRGGRDVSSVPMHVPTGMWDLCSLPCSFLWLLLTLGPAMHTLKTPTLCVQNAHWVRAGNRQFMS